MGAQRSAIPEHVREQAVEIGCRLALARRLQRMMSAELAVPLRRAGRSALLLVGGGQLQERGAQKG